MTANGTQTTITTRQGTFPAIWMNGVKYTVAGLSHRGFTTIVRTTDDRFVRLTDGSWLDRHDVRLVSDDFIDGYVRRARVGISRK